MVGDNRGRLQVDHQGIAAQCEEEKMQEMISVQISQMETSTSLQLSQFLRAETFSFEVGDWRGMKSSSFLDVEVGSRKMHGKR